MRFSGANFSFEFPRAALVMGVVNVTPDSFSDGGEFLEPEREVLVARNGAEVAAQVLGLTRERAGEIGEAALRRVLSEHTYAHRAVELEKVLDGDRARRPALAAV